MSKSLAELFTPDKRDEIIEKSRKYWAADRIDQFSRLKTLIIMGKRSGYKFQDISGKEFIDFHINGGVFSLGHRNPQLVSRLQEALEFLDIGNHHFVSPLRARVAERLIETTGGAHQFVVFAPGGGEAIDIAIRSARWATNKRKIVSVKGGFHGRSGLSGLAGDQSNAQYFKSDRPEEFISVPFNDLEALEEAVRGGDVAAILVETILASVGFVQPKPGYLQALRELCDKNDVIYIADEIQTGLMRSGTMWAVDTYGVKPDILVTGKGFGGGLYPVAAAILTERTGAWLRENGWGYVATASGAELGLAVADAVLDILGAPETIKSVQWLIDSYTRDFAELLKHPFVEDIYQKGLIIGIKTKHPKGGAYLSRSLYDIGLWAFPAGFDQSILQFKPGLLMDAALYDESFGLLQQGLDRTMEFVRSR